MYQLLSIQDQITKVYYAMTGSETGPLEMVGVEPEVSKFVFLNASSEIYLQTTCDQYYVKYREHLVAIEMMLKLRGDNSGVAIGDRVICPGDKAYYVTHLSDDECSLITGIPSWYEGQLIPTSGFWKAIALANVDFVRVESQSTNVILDIQDNQRKRRDRIVCEINIPTWELVYR